MRFEKLKLHITNHAYNQYCDRVEKIEYGELLFWTGWRLFTGDYHRKAEYLKIDGVWWVFDVEDEQIHFITCYGMTHLYLPAALKWERQHRDRVRLN